MVLARNTTMVITLVVTTTTPVWDTIWISSFFYFFPICLLCNFICDALN
ncbi:hypothetical protein SLEP1_g55884 [Rubroshorea leprosula]|uniref:Uncharacterized protein n=1 Tax=Rubroshorea leprosula TaxID=152421 RepID=A0AAV5MKK5_9ROSI|nr:hypothetical protein SLEP1_g55884 [Rubroshorea leprosula]